ncbi:MAG: SpoIIE family protein phosphatase [Bernardetiaceae bacterium]|nr:SpoIIE family protein phosphatase [Bernardetiaceae bacterium]
MPEQSIIICVDDEPMVLDSLKAELSENLDGDIYIETAESGEEAIELLEFLAQRDSQQVAVVISDYIMPNMLGDELLTRIHEQYPEIIKILLTGQSSKEGIISALHGASLYRYIAKPWCPTDLSLTVKGALENYQKHQKLKTQSQKLAKLNQELENKIEESSHFIEQKARELQQSIAYAQIIQQGMLPEKTCMDEYFKDYFILNKPRDVVSGDFYWVHKNNNQLIVVVADCTGHGIPGAFTSMIGESLLNYVIIEQNITQPKDILEALHQSITQLWEKEQSSNHDGMDLSLCLIDYETQILTFAGAKNPICIVQNNEQMQVVRGSRKSIGERFMKKKQVKFAQKQISLARYKNYIYMYSDGYQDQLGGGLKKQKFMSTRFRDLLATLPPRTMAQQQEILVHTLKEWQGKGKQIDDILVLGFSIDFSPPHA